MVCAPLGLGWGRGASRRSQRRAPRAAVWVVHRAGDALRALVGGGVLPIAGRGAPARWFARSSFFIWNAPGRWFEWLRGDAYTCGFIFPLVLSCDLYCAWDPQTTEVSDGRQQRSAETQTKAIATAKKLD